MKPPTIWVHRDPYSRPDNARVVYLPSEEQTSWLTSAEWANHMSPMAALELAGVIESEPRTFDARWLEKDQSPMVYLGASRNRLVVELLLHGYQKTDGET